MNRADRRQAEEALAQMTARRQALEELERDRVGLAPAAAALLAARDQFDGGVLGPLSDFVSTGRQDAELAERLLGDWMHAVLVRSEDTVKAIQSWHAEHQPGALVLLPLDPGTGYSGRRPSRWTTGCGRKEPAAAGSAPRWPARRFSTTRAGSSAGPAAPFSSPAPARPPARSAAGRSSRLWRRKWPRPRLAGRAPMRPCASRSNGWRSGSTTLAEAASAAERARDAERQALATRDDVLRVVGNLAREAADSEAQLEQMTERVTRSEQRLAEIDAALVQGELNRGPGRRRSSAPPHPAGGAGGRSGECPGTARPLAGAGGARGRESARGHRAARAAPDAPGQRPRRGSAR